MKRRVWMLVALTWLVSWAALAADWPQFRGPSRDDLSRETGLLKKWPASGPKLVWTNKEAGIGYSGPAVVSGIVYTMGSWEGKEHVYALDAKTGKRLWAAEFGNEFKNGYGDGPRSTPTVDGGFLYAMGGQGTLVCMETKGGKVVWSKSMQKDLKGKMMSGWGYTESPLVDGDLVVCSPGGGDGTLAALNKKTGAVVWRSKDFKDSACYSSPIMAQVGGVKQYIQMTGEGVGGVSAKDGSLIWRYPRQHKTAAIPTPIFADNQVYITAGYGVGCSLVKLDPKNDKVEIDEVYFNKTLVNHHGGVVKVGDYLYGYSDSGGWTCQEFKTGKAVWQDKKLGKGSITYADGMLYCYAEGDGTCVLIEASPKGWQEHGRFKIPEQTTKRSKQGKIWTHPVICDGRLYLRDQDLIFCFDVSAAGGE